MRSLTCDFRFPFPEAAALEPIVKTEVLDWMCFPACSVTYSFKSRPVRIHPIYKATKTFEMQVKNVRGESSFWKRMKQKFQVKAKSHPKHGFIPMALLNGEVLYYP